MAVTCWRELARNYAGLVFLLGCPYGVASQTAAAAAPPLASAREAKAAAELEGRGAQIWRESAPGKPVFAVKVFADRIRARDFALLAAFPHLRELDVAHPEGGILHQIDLDAALVHVRQLTSLEKLYLGGGRVADAGLAHVSNLRRLRLLAVEEDVTDAGLKHLTGLKKLRELGYLRSTIRGDGLKHLAALPKLERLYLCRAKIERKTLRPLASLTRLHTLDLTHSTVTDAHLADLGSLRELVFLDLDNTAVTGKGLARLAPCPRLRMLGLQNTAVTDETLAEVAKLRQLESLWLRNCRITNAGVDSLARLKRLRNIDLSRTKVDKEGVARLQKALPAARISHGR
jgi:hypothetical protein